MFEIFSVLRSNSQKERHDSHIFMGAGQAYVPLFATTRARVGLALAIRGRASAGDNVVHVLVLIVASVMDGCRAFSFTGRCVWLFVKVACCGLACLASDVEFSKSKRCGVPDSMHGMSHLH